MSLNRYRQFLLEQYQFYSRSRSQPRNEPGFPWQLVDSNFSSWRYRIKRAPWFRRLYNTLTPKPLPTLKAGWEGLIEPHLEPIYEVRTLLSDDLSRFLYDQTLLLRALTCHRFYFPKLEVETWAHPVAEEDFLETGLPHDYLGTPLKIFNLKLNTQDDTIPVRLIAAEGFVELLNDYRQYLIHRNFINLGPRPGDVVLDCGACIGDVSAIFAALAGKNGQVHLFDPTPLHIKFCTRQAELNPHIAENFILNAQAVGKASRQIHAGSTLDSMHIQPGALSIDRFEMTSLDDYVLQKGLSKIDFIKMDIEGFETEAIEGAARLIQEFKPRLAISIYHRPEDFWSIPLQIAKLNPHYRFAFGHHSPVDWASVIYAY